MKNAFKHRLVLWVLLPLVVFLAADTSLLAQGCALCKSTLARQAAGLLRAINSGIMILLFPPVIMMSLILIAAFRKRE
ncbi:MAG: hypothetical protein HY645_14140 [Acidobacteria bacterium]|nr:hypothetical protein [Acidobacteriota bacterium]